MDPMSVLKALRNTAISFDSDDMGFVEKEKMTKSYLTIVPAGTRGSQRQDPSSYFW